MIIKGRAKALRRRGQTPMPEPFIEEDDHRKQQCRVQVKREQPFRGASNDVCQVCDRSNVDFQFLMCAPAPIEGGGALPHAAASEDAEEPVERPKRRRITKKSPPLTKKPSAAFKPRNARKWLYGSGVLRAEDGATVDSFAVAFQKAYAMDFYITKYQGKMMEALTPLFQTMTSGIHRLEEQEKQEEEELKARTLQAEDAANPQPKRRKTKEDLARRARRVCIRLASMGNRCYWLSACEVTVHILTGGDCLQSHNNLRLFTRQLQWMMQQSKRQLNLEATVEEDGPKKEQSIGAVTVRMRVEAQEDSSAAQPMGENADDDEMEVLHVEACTSSTNIADDFAHRGERLQTMPFYVYRMYVRRILRSGRSRVKDPTVFAFDDHYPLSKTYAQEVSLHNINVPTIYGFQCPTWTQDPEQNALLKTLLFTPWRCLDPMSCGTCEKFAHMLSNGTCLDFGAAQPAVLSARKFTFEHAWRLRCSEVHVLAQRADDRCDAAHKKLVLADTIFFAGLKKPATVAYLTRFLVGRIAHSCRLQGLNGPNDGFLQLLVLELLISFLAGCPFSSLGG